MKAARSWRWSLRRLAFALVLGAVTNVLVTAWCVWMILVPASQIGKMGFLSLGERRFLVNLSSTPGKTVFRWEPEPPAGFGLVTGIDIAPTPPSWANMDVELRTPQNMSGRMPLDSFAVPTRYEIAYGWPLLSFRGGVLAINWQRPRLRHDFAPELPEIRVNPSIPLSGEPRTMPLMPMWPGVVVNTGVYGALWWLVLGPPVMWRRWKRLRRGACVECGYDRRGLGAEAACPECGAGGSGLRAEAPS